MPDADVYITAHYGDIIINDGEPIPGYTYTGQPVEHKLKVELDGVDYQNDRRFKGKSDAVLIENEDYKVDYNNNINAGTCRIYVYAANGVNKEIKVTVAN